MLNSPAATTMLAPHQTWGPGHSRQNSQPNSPAHTSSVYWKGATAETGATRRARKVRRWLASSTAALAAITPHIVGEGIVGGTKSRPTRPARPMLAFCVTIIDRSDSVLDSQRTQVMAAA